MLDNRTWSAPPSAYTATVLPFRSCTAWTVSLPNSSVVYPTTADKYFAPKPGTMPPTQPVLEGARPWSHTFFIQRSAKKLMQHSADGGYARRQIQTRVGGDDHGIPLA